MSTGISTINYAPIHAIFYVMIYVLFQIKVNHRKGVVAAADTAGASEEGGRRALIYVAFSLGLVMLYATLRQYFFDRS